MSTTKRKPKPKGKTAVRFRNAGPFVPKPRAKTDPAAVSQNGSVPGGPESAGWHLVNTAVGALAASAVGAYATRWGFAPRTIASVLTAVGGYAAYTRPSPRARSFSAGAASAAGSQVLLLTLKAPTPAAPTVIVATKSQPSAPHKNADLGALPSGALDAAFERARAQLAISSDVPSPEAEHEHAHRFHHDHVPFVP